MFSKLMDDLSLVYTGKTIYVPEKLRVFLEPWLHQKAKSPFHALSQRPGGGFQSMGASNKDGYRWNSKKVLFFCEDELTKAYKKMPIPHTPEKITEEAFTIEFTLTPTEAARGQSSRPWQHGAAQKVERKNKKGGKLW